jgi:hypothetical protein
MVAVVIFIIRDECFIANEVFMRKQLTFLFIALMGFSVFSLSGILPSSAQYSQTYGTGWSAFLYDDPSFSTHVALASFPSGLNFTWAGAPRDGVGNPITRMDSTPFIREDDFSVRFISTQYMPISGTYVFSGYVDDRMVVYIGPDEVYRRDVPGNFDFRITLTQGNVNMRIDFVEISSSAALQFSWRLDSGIIIPTFPPPNYTPPPPVTPTPAGPVLPEGPIGQVINVRGLSLRTGPYLGASYIGALRPGIAYPVLAQNTDEGGGFVWYKVQNGPYVGWASGRYFTVINGEVPVEQTVFETLGNPQSIGVLATPNAYVNVRHRPSIRSPRIGTLQVAWGDQVEVLGRTVQGGENRWLLVRYQGVVGWVVAPYFRTTQGGFHQVPIY